MLLNLLRHGRTEWPSRCNIVEWEQIAATACEERLGGLLYSIVDSNGVEIPAEIRFRLKAEHDHNLETNRLRLAEVERLSRAFHDAGIDVLVLKGAALLLDLYDNPGDRGMDDIDILIRPEAAARAEALLSKLGMKRGPALLRRDFYPNYHYEAAYVGGRRLPVRWDVHVRPFRPIRCCRTVAVDALWSERRAVAFEGGRIHIPGPADMLIHLLGHSAFHGGNALRWHVDIHRYVIRHNSAIDWATFVDRVDRWRLGAAVRFAMSRTETALGRCFPDSVRDDLHRGRESWRDRLALRQSPTDRTSPLRAVLVNLLCVPGVRFRLGYLAAVLLPDRAHLEQVYPRRHWGWQWVAVARRAMHSVRTVAH